MNKKIIIGVVLICLFGCVLTGCGGAKAESADSSNTNPASNESIDVSDESNNATGDVEVDLDLTTLSSTVVYSEVYNMITSPNDYIGKKVRMEGLFVPYSNQDQSMYYPAVIIADATACCSQGLEFVLEGEPSYPEGYPEAETEITVVGTFETYEENGDMYCHLVNSVIE